MNEFLMANWVEVGFTLLMVVFLLMIIFVNMCYQEAKREYEEQRVKELSKKEKEELKKMMPELPKEDK